LEALIFRGCTPETTLLIHIPAFLALGVAAGLLGVLFNRSLLVLQRTARLPGRLKPLWWLVVGG
jgi:H+/Cl- antiporter ClcA